MDSPRVKMSGRLGCRTLWAGVAIGVMIAQAISMASGATGWDRALIMAVGAGGGVALAAAIRRFRGR